MCPRALSLCRGRQGRDDFTHHNAVPLPLCAGQGTPEPPWCLAQRGSPGTGTDPYLSGGPKDPWLGLVDSSNPKIKPDDVPSLCVRPPSLEQFCFLPEPHKPTISQTSVKDHRSWPLFKTLSNTITKCLLKVLKRRAICVSTPLRTCFVTNSFVP